MTEDVQSCNEVGGTGKMDHDNAPVIDVKGLSTCLSLSCVVGH
jgi:hypothetical protein